MWTAVLPIDICKTRLQLADDNRNLLWHARQVVTQEGWVGMYAGFRPTVARAFPANAAQWLAWEAAMRAIFD